MNKKLIICLVNNLVIFLIHIYRTIFSSLFSPCCRFTPSCSSYAQESIRRFGIKKGFVLTIKRVLKCHPFHPGGYDPVPVDIYFKNQKSMIDEN